MLSFVLNSRRTLFDRPIKENGKKKAIKEIARVVFFGKLYYYIKYCICIL